MKQYLFSILSFFFIITLGSCATEEYASIVGQIEGTVINEISKEPIESCEVISPHNGTSLTDSHGRFTFQDVIPGTIQLTYKRLGFETATREVTVQAGKTTPANASLTPEATDCQLTPNTTILDFGNRDAVVELILKNTSNQSITYTIQCDAAEVSFDPKRGTIIGGNSSIIKVAVDRTELSEGHYERTASIVTADSSIDIQIVFDKGSETRPTVCTLALEQDDTTPTTIIAKGAITSVGSSNIIQHGFCYSTEPEPSLTENEGVTKLGSLSSPADFTCNITKLDFEKQYYVRAYATNKQGTSYGEVVSIVLEHKDNISIVTQDASSITSTSARLNVKINGGSVSDLSEIGFYYGTTEKCEKKIVVDASEYQTASTLGAVINDLKSDTEYFFKGYGVTSSGEKTGEVKSFKTAKESSEKALTCETLSVTNLTDKSATLKGKIVGGTTSSVSRYGFYYGTTSACNERCVDVRTSDGTNFEGNLTNLSADRDYYFKAFCITSMGEKCGEVISFHTDHEPLPDGSIVCGTSAATSITVNSAILNGNFSVSGTIKVKEWGFYYGTSSTPSIRSVCGTNKMPVAISSKTLSQKIEKLSEGTTYYFQSYAIDELNNIFKGPVESFTTPGTPTIKIISLKVDKILDTHGQKIAEKLYADAYIEPYGATIIEAGFIYRSDGYDLSYNSNYNGTTIKIQCEIINNYISCETTYGGPASSTGVYIRAYIVLADGTVIYNGNKIYAYPDMNFNPQ